MNEEDKEISIIDTIADPSNSPLVQLEKEELRKKIDKALSILPEKQRRRVIMRFINMYHNQRKLNI